MTESMDALAHDPSPDGAVVAGSLLRAGREAAGLSVAAVAQQLKLAPRQIAAMEEGDYSKLPGRTFVRGFVRNYARLLRLDCEAVLATLPGTAAAASLDSASLAPTPRPMGELPADAPLKPGAARWAIPLVLVAVVAVAAVYEIARPPAAPANPTAIDKAAIPAAAVAEAAPVPTQPSTTTSLPNPLIAANANADVKPDLKPAIARENENSGRDPDSGAVPAPAVATAESASAPTAAGPVALKFHGTSWVEVRDATGAIVAQLTGRAGDTQAVNGRAPFDVILGNAAAADVTWQGQPFDTTPYTRQNVARFTLR